MKKLIFALLFGLILSSSIAGNTVYKSASNINNTDIVVISSTDPGNGGAGGGH